MQDQRLWKKLKHSSVLVTPKESIHAAFDRQCTDGTIHKGAETPVMADNRLALGWTPGASTALPQFLPKIHASTWRHRIAFHIDLSGFGRVWELFDAALNLAFCALYVYHTTFTDKGLPRSTQMLDYGFAAALLFQFIPKIFISVDFTRFFLSPLNLLTWLSCIPVFLAANDATAYHSYMSAGNYAFVYPFRFFRLHVAIMVCLVRGLFTMHFHH